MAAMAMDKKWIDIFNQKFEEFIKDMIVVFPHDKDFKVMKNSFNLLKMADEKKPLEIFSKYSARFEEPVRNRDESFFLTSSYDDIQSDETNLTDELIDKLKSYWKSLSDDNKETIWKYLDIFFKLKAKIG